MGNKIQLDFEKMDDRAILLYLVMRLNNLPETVSGIQRWQDKITGGGAVIASTAFVSLLISVWRWWGGG